MVLFPNCKINIGLDILAKRPDGYHDIETVMFPVMGLSDIIEILPSASDIFLASGVPLDCPAQDNICIKAVKLLRESCDIPPVSIRLEKIVPYKAGLGGGSSDGAFVLKGLNELFSLGLSDGMLEMIGRELGSDVPFFVRNRPMVATGRGEILSPIDLSLSGKYVFIVKPPLDISTRQAYQGVVPGHKLETLAQRLKNPIETWNELISNDFEQSIFEIYPMLLRLKLMLYKSGALYAQLSGSGSSIFAIFDGKPPRMTLPPEMFTFQQQIE